MNKLSGTDKKEVCTYLGNKFGVRPHESWGTMSDIDLRAFWDHNGGNTLYTPPPGPSAPTYKRPAHVYLANWGWETTLPRAAQLKKATVVINSFWGIKADGSVSGRIGAQEKILANLGPRIYAAVGGWGSASPFAKVWGDTATCLASVLALGKAVTDCGWHGIDIDWEYPATDSEKRVLVNFLKMFRQYWPLLDISIALGYDPENMIGYATDLNIWCDWFHVMTYDFVGSWQSKAGHNSDLPTGATVMTRLTESGLLRSKLMLGSAWYGRGMSGCIAPNQKVKSWTELPFSEIEPLITQAGWQSTAGLGCDWAAHVGDNRCISFESPQAIDAKLRWTEELGYAGVFCWEWTQDSESGALAKAMLK